MSWNKGFDHGISHPACPCLIKRFATAISRGGICPTQLADEWTVTRIMNDAPGAAIRQDKRRTSGSADAIGMMEGDACPRRECSKGREGNNVVFFRCPSLDRIESDGILRDEPNGGVGIGQVHSGISHMELHRNMMSIIAKVRGDSCKGISVVCVQFFLYNPQTKWYNVF